MRQKRTHTWTVSFVEVPLGPLRAGGAPESTKQPRYPGTERAAESGFVRCLQKGTVPRQPSAPTRVRPGPLTVARGNVAVAPVDTLLCLGYVAPRLHVAVRVPAGGGEVVRISPPQMLQIPGPTPQPIRKMATLCVRTYLCVPLRCRTNSGLSHVLLDVDFRGVGGESLKGP